MRSITFEGVGRTALSEVPEPILQRPTEVLIDIAMTGICGTDQKIVNGLLEVGAPGTILGHEGVGTVRAIGDDVKGLQPGDRVVVNPTQSCLQCLSCRRGNFCYCANFDDYQVGFTLPGTFASQFKTVERWLYTIPEEMSWELASLAEPLGCCLNTVTKATLQPWESVLIIGGGPIGQMCAFLAQQAAGTVALVEPLEARREFALPWTSSVAHPDDATPRWAASVTGSPAFDVIIDAVGNQAARAIPLLGKGGRLVLMGYDTRYSVEVSTTAMIDNGQSIVAAVPLHDAVGPAMAILKSHRELERLVTHHLAMEDFITGTGGRSALTASSAAIGMKAVVLSD